MTVVVFILVALIGASAYRIHVLEQQVGAAVPTCNTDKLETTVAAQTLALDAAQTANDTLQTELSVAQALAESARVSQTQADTRRTALMLKLSDLNHAQAQVVSCDVWLRAPVPCDFGL